jgi:hypothetical protein
MRLRAGRGACAQQGKAERASQRDAAKCRGHFVSSAMHGEWNNYSYVLIRFALILDFGGQRVKAIGSPGLPG